MLVNFIAQLGPWSWLALGLLLLLFEVMAPGVFLLWIGIAAIITGALSLALWGAAFWIWQIQVVLFLVLSLICVVLGKRYFTSRDGGTDQPLLNRRGAQMIGRTATLTEPISNGRGRVQLGDTMWRVSGPDLPAGSRIRVVSASDADLELQVEQF